MNFLQSLLAASLCAGLAFAGSPPSVGKVFYRSLNTRPALTPPHFPAPALPGGVYVDEQPSCYYSRGIAYVDPTLNNIQHLSDVEGQQCVAQAGDCARVAYQNQSGLFFCNYNSAYISTECGNLVGLAKKLHEGCQIANYYSFGIIGGKLQNGTDQVNYYLGIAGEEP